MTVMLSHAPKPAFLVGLALCLVAATGLGEAKEYNKRTHLSPEQGAKVQRVLVDTRTPLSGTEIDTKSGSGGVTNVGCGGLALGNVQPKVGQRVDRDIIITGDVINAAPQGCRR